VPRFAVDDGVAVTSDEVSSRSDGDLEAGMGRIGARDSSVAMEFRNEIASSGTGRRRGAADLRFWEIVEYALMAIVIGSTVLTVYLHRQFVEDGSCLQQALREQHSLVGKVVDRAEYESNETYKAVAIKEPGLLSDSLLRINAFNSYSTGHGSLVADYDQVLDHDGRVVGSASEKNFAVDYEFSCSSSVARMNSSLYKVYGISTYNVSLHADCLAPSSPYIRSFWVNLIRVAFGVDAIVVNQAMYAFQCDGYLKNLATKEIWSWDKRDFDYLNYGLFRKAVRKLAAFFMSILSFALVSQITALLVRVLVTSGVAITFPLFNLFQRLGLNQHRRQLLSLSYPWLGAQIELLHTSNQSSNPLVSAHLFNVLLYYTMYEACQIVWSFWLYNKSMPAGQMQQIFGLVMICEYFSMIFARSLLTIQFFPRVMMFYYIAFHLYFYLVPYGFTSMATITWYAACLHAMVYCLRYHEVKAFQRGRVSFEQPRSLYSEIPQPQWNMLLPPLWSMFYPLNRSQRSIYDDEDSVANYITDTTSTVNASISAPPVQGVSPRESTQEVSETEVSSSRYAIPGGAVARAAEARRRAQSARAVPVVIEEHDPNHDHAA